MEPRLTGINENEALLYLGYRGGAVPPELRRDIARCRELLLKTARPRLVWRQFDLLPDGTLHGTGFCPEGKDVRALLTDCRRVVLMGATLGAEVEALLLRAQVQNMADAVILDCCASSAIENVCDNFCEDLQAEVAPAHLTDRFSPGYGDFPLDCQRYIAPALELGKRIGVTLTDSLLMAPSKSVTAVIGVSRLPRNCTVQGCEVCAKRDCAYRR